LFAPGAAYHPSKIRQDPLVIDFWWRYSAVTLTRTEVGLRVS